MGWWIGVAILLTLFLAVMTGFNRLVRLRQNVRESWSAIDTELKRRYELIPNLVETVRGYATHERHTLENVIAARNAAAGNSGAPPDQVQTENNLTHSIRQIFAIAESYPQLKANQSFQQLQSQLAETETRISQARRFYNANVREINTAVQVFPLSFVARIFGFGSEPYFEIEDPGQRDAVAVRI
jgi:LemA protein